MRTTYHVSSDTTVTVEKLGGKERLGKQVYTLDLDGDLIIFATASQLQSIARTITRALNA